MAGSHGEHGGMQDVLARFVAKHGEDWALLPEKAMFQMNDTHPTIAVAELMRLLLDEHSLDWDTAWGLTTKARAHPSPLPGAHVVTVVFTWAHVVTVAFKWAV